MSANTVVRSRRFGRPAGCLVAVTAGVLAISATSAWASPAAQQFKGEASYRYAGYRSSGPTTSASVRFTVPTLSCTDAKMRSVEFGVSVQTGAAPAFGGVIATCDRSRASYEAFLDLGGQGRGVSGADAGDTIEASATVVGSKVAFRVTNLTQTGTAQMGGTFDVRSVSVGITGIKTGAVLLGVPNFRTVNFTKVSLANRPLNPGTAVRITRITPDSKVQIRTNLPSADGRGFSAAYVAS